MVHGGPTSQALADWAPQVQAFVQRGWTVLQPDYPGLDGLRPRVHAGARRASGATGTSPTSRPASGTPRRKGWADSATRRDHGRERRAG